MFKKLSLIFIAFAFLQNAFGQGTKVVGSIKDGQGNPLPAVLVLEKGTRNGTYSNVNGTYTIIVSSDNVTLLFSSLGYEKLELRAGDAKNIVMRDATVSLKGVEIVGTRSLNRSSTTTPVPIDILPVSKLAESKGQLDLNQLLQYAAPSFNSTRQSGSDGSDHVDPASLRGMGPDQTLVLINGKRLHQSSLINIYGTRGRGNTGTDLNAIPIAAIDHIEVLRDGASAQYGSDAIAGVMNIVLRNNTGQFTGNINGGTFMTGYGKSLDDKAVGAIIPKATDGANFNINGNYGFKLKNNSVISITADYLKKEKTFRPNNTKKFPDSDYRAKFGDASYDNASIYLNANFPLGKSGGLYLFGGYNHRNGDAFAWTRDAGSPRNVVEIYPNGFNPRIETKINDATATIGYKTQLKSWTMDISNTFGYNKFHYFGDGTLNASLEAKSPTRFDDGGFGMSSDVVNLDFSRSFAKVLQGLNFATGAEFRTESYNIFAGEEASWKTYGPVLFSADSAFDDNGNFAGFDSIFRPGGAQGFPGFQDADALTANRSNIGAYADFELDIVKGLLATVAFRFENYSDFGSTFNYKAAARYSFNDKFVIRASAGTGFRAPSLAQINFRSTYTNVIGGKVVDAVIANNESDLARAVGIAPLKEEVSSNFGFGVTANPMSNISITVDAYQVKVQDRIVLTGSFFDDDDAIGAALIEKNVAAAQFFTNALNTTTTGLDAIINWAPSIKANRFNIALAANFNKMELDEIKTTDKLKDKKDVYFGPREKAFLLASAPPFKISFSIDYRIKKFTAALRLTQFAEVELKNWRVLGDGDLADAALADGNTSLYNDLVTDTYEARMVTDVSMGYDILPSLKLVVGASNLFDVYPSIQDSGWTEGGGMWDSVQMGNMGAFYFVKLGLRF